MGYQTCLTPQEIMWSLPSWAYVYDYASCWCAEFRGSVFTFVDMELQRNIPQKSNSVVQRHSPHISEHTAQIDELQK